VVRLLAEARRRASTWDPAGNSPRDPGRNGSVEDREVTADGRRSEAAEARPVGPALYVVVGLPAAGKTTRARALASAYDAVRLNPDEWMTDLGVDLFDEPFRARLEQRMTRLAAEVLAGGGRVVIEFGSWFRAERDDLLALGRRAGAHVELHVLEPDPDELWRRLTERNQRSGEAVIDRTTLDSYLPHWESPDNDELARYDAVAR
jgi:predicted kinase